MAAGGTTSGPGVPNSMAGSRRARIESAIRALMSLARKVPPTSSKMAATTFPKSACLRDANSPAFGTPIATLHPDTVERLKPVSTLTPSSVTPSKLPSAADLSARMRSGETFFPTNSSPPTVLATIVSLLSTITATQSDGIFCWRRIALSRSGNMPTARE